MAVSRLAIPVFPFYQPIYASVISFKVSLRPFTPLTKSRSSTDSEVCLDCYFRPYDLLTLFPVSEIPHEGPMADLVWSDPDPEKEDFAISPR